MVKMEKMKRIAFASSKFGQSPVEFETRGHFGWPRCTMSPALLAVALSMMLVLSPATQTWGGTAGLLKGFGSDQRGQLGTGHLINGESTQDTNTTVLSPKKVRSGVSVAAAGTFHTLYITQDGTLWAVGNNQLGQLGNGTFLTLCDPVLVAKGVKSVAGGYAHSLFIKTDGTLWAMGGNSRGQLGDGSRTSRLSPVQIAKGVAAVAASGSRSFFIKTDGTLWAMGENGNGQLGDGTTVTRFRPVRIATGVSAVAAGDSHTLFTKKDGTLWACGNNGFGQLGDRSTTQRPTPVKVAAGVASIAAAQSSSYYVTKTGQLWAMGRNDIGALGDGTRLDRHSPVKIAGGVAQVAAAGYRAHFVKTDGSLWGMGSQVGDGTEFQRSTPVRIATGASRVSSSTYHTLIIKTDHTLWALGKSTYGQLADGTADSRWTPATIQKEVVSMSAGFDFTLFIKSDGSLWGMGDNSAGQLGDGSTTARSVPVQIATNVVMAAAGARHSLFVKKDGTLWAMGANENGEMGVGLPSGWSGDDRTHVKPERVDANVVYAAAGDNFSLYVKADGTLWGMGINGRGQLGDGTTNTRWKPVRVTNNVKMVTAGDLHALFVKKDGTLWGMGDNMQGQLGAEQGALRYSPVLVAKKVQQAWAGNDHSLFLKTDGTLWAMGDNLSGEYDNGSYVYQIDAGDGWSSVVESRPSLKPFKIASNVLTAAVGYNRSFYVTKDGALWGMGFNSNGQTGEGTTMYGYCYSPAKLATGVSSVVAGAYHTLVLNGKFLGASPCLSVAEIGGPSIERDTSSNVLPFRVKDGDTPAEKLTVTGRSSDPKLLPASGIVVTGTGANRSLVLTPARGATGTAQVTLTVSDGLLNSSAYFTAVVVRPPGEPTLGPIADQTVDEDHATKILRLDIRDDDVPIDDLTLTATSSNALLVPVSNIVFGAGSGSSRTVRVIPATDRYGTATITVTVAYGRLKASRSFKVTVKPVNDAPTITTPSNLLFAENGTMAVAFTVGDAETSAASLIVTASSTNAALFPTTALVLGGSGAKRTLSLVPTAGLTGGADITLNVSDGSLSRAVTFSAAVHERPAISAIPDQITDKGTGTGAIGFTVSDKETAASNLTIAVDSSNQALVPLGNIFLGGAGSDRTITITPAPNQMGTATIRLTVNDGDLEASTSFVLTVRGPSGAPVIGLVPNQTMDEDTVIAAIPFTVSDAETPAGDLSVTAASSNETLLPVENITFEGEGGDRMVRLQPAGDQNGTALVTLTVKDGTLTTSTTFIVTVSAVNDAPTISTPANVMTSEDTPTPAIAFTIGDVETTSDSLRVTAATSNAALLPVENIALAGKGAERTIVLTPVADKSGSAVVTLTVSDGALSTRTQFKLDVTSVNDAPTITAISDQFLLPKTATPALPFRIGDVDDAIGALVVTVTSSNPALVPTGNIVLAGSGANRTIKVTPVATAVGSTIIALTVSDGRSAVQTSFSIKAGTVPGIASARRQVVVPGQAFSVSVTANGANPVSCQWYHDGRAIEGATSLKYTQSKAGPADGGAYWAEVCSAAGVGRSSAMFVVCAPTRTQAVSWGQNGVRLLQGMDRIVAIVSSSDVLALRADGTLVGGGSRVPSGLSDIVAIAADGRYFLGLKADGTVVAWGSNLYGQCTLPTGLTGVIAIATGPRHALALKQDGTVVAWGDNDVGQSSIPMGLTGVVAIAAGVDHSLALKADGSVVGWGANALGQISAPASLGAVSRIAAGGANSMVLMTDGTVKVWGGNEKGQCAVPTNLGGVARIALGLNQCLALKSDGTVVGWGDNTYHLNEIPAKLTQIFAVSAAQYGDFAVRDATADLMTLAVAAP